MSNDIPGETPLSAATVEGRPFRFAGKLGGGIVLLMVGNLVTLTGASVDATGLVAVGAIASLVGLIVTVVGITAQAAAIEGIARALHVVQPSRVPAQQTNDEFFGKKA